MSAVLPNTYLETPYEFLKTDLEVLSEEVLEHIELFQNNIHYYIARMHREWNCYLELREFDEDITDSNSDTEFDSVDGILVPDFTRARYKILLTVCQGNTRITLEDAQRKYLLECIQKVYDLLHTNDDDTPEIIFLDLNRNLVYKSELMSSSWMRNVVPKLIDSTSRIHDNLVFSKDLTQDFNQTYLEFISNLRLLFRRGTVAVPDNHPSIQDWQLVESTTSPGIYHPMWFNSLLAPDISSFLLLATTGSTRFEIKLPNGIDPDSSRYPLTYRNDQYAKYLITTTNYKHAATQVRNMYGANI